MELFKDLKLTTCRLHIDNQGMRDFASKVQKVALSALVRALNILFVESKELSEPDQHGQEAESEENSNHYYNQLIVKFC